jgi:hypothetical protein
VRDGSDPADVASPESNKPAKVRPAVIAHITTSGIAVRLAAGSWGTRSKGERFWSQLGRWRTAPRNPTTTQAARIAHETPTQRGISPSRVKASPAMIHIGGA